MSRDILLLFLEYSAIPIGLLVYTVIIKQLSASDPISSHNGEYQLWSYGLELMLIISISTLLYGVSFAGHSEGKEISAPKLHCIIWCLIAAMFEFFTTIFITLKVRHWGENDHKTKIYPNVAALICWLCLISLILICSNYTHSTELQQLPVPEVVEISSTNTILQSPWRILAFAAVFLIVSFFIVKYIIVQIKRKAVIEYNKGSRLLTNNPTGSINNLERALKNTPVNSAMIVDTYMKLSRLYTDQGDKEKGLIQIELLQNTPAYDAFPPYLKDGILKAKFTLLIDLGRIADAEALLSTIQNSDMISKLKSILYELKRQTIQDR